MQDTKAGKEKPKEEPKLDARKTTRKGGYTIPAQRKRAVQDCPARIPKTPKVEIGIPHTPHISSSPNVATGMPLRY